MRRTGLRNTHDKPDEWFDQMPTCFRAHISAAQLTCFFISVFSLYFVAINYSCSYRQSSPTSSEPLLVPPIPAFIHLRRKKWHLQQDKIWMGVSFLGENNRDSPTTLRCKVIYLQIKICPSSPPGSCSNLPQASSHLGNKINNLYFTIWTPGATEMVTLSIFNQSLGQRGPVFLSFHSPLYRHLPLTFTPFLSLFLLPHPPTPIPPSLVPLLTKSRWWMGERCHLHAHQREAEAG